MEKKNLMLMIRAFFETNNSYFNEFHDIFCDYHKGAIYDNLDRCDLNNLMYALMGLTCATFGHIKRDLHLELVNLVESIHNYLEG